MPEPSLITLHDVLNSKIDRVLFPIFTAFIAYKLARKGALKDQTTACILDIAKKSTIHWCSNPKGKENQSRAIEIQADLSNLATRIGKKKMKKNSISEAMTNFRKATTGDDFEKTSRSVADNNNLRITTIKDSAEKLVELL